MDTTAASFGIIVAIGIAVAITTLFSLMLLISMRTLRRRVEQSLAQAEEANGQLQALRQELHGKKPPGQSSPPRHRPPVEDNTPPIARPAGADETMVIRRR